MDHLSTGSGKLAGGTAAAEELAKSIGILNYSGAIASNIMSIAQNAEKGDKARREKSSKETNEEELTYKTTKQRYKDATRITS
jgi:hypothetical protein